MFMGPISEWILVNIDEIAEASVTSATKTCTLMNG
jgi:hypothetical protein